ncbi:MAG: ABC transporter substrate-binding protein [Deltaproteobacteria bacterium]|jgi:peptide/nickel transport system substrate-binding protein|nr:ABC transporter substrate-binding protein [Deltaproteobacteria bacterium]
MRQRKSLFFILLTTIIVCGLSFSAPVFAETVLKVGTLSNDANQLDPHVSTKSQDKILFPWIFNGLVRFKPGSADLKQIEADLAKSWTNSEDGLTWTFKLRKGVQFHAGYGELTSEDVVFSLNRASNKETSTAYKGYADFASVTAPDKYTVKIILAKPIPSLLGMVTNYHGGYVVSKKAVEKLGDNFKTNPIGTGPFAFSEYQSKRQVTLVANQDYFRGAPKIDKIIYRYLPDESSRELAFKNGELDLIYGTREQRWVERIRKDKNTKVDIIGLGELRTLHMNASKGPLKDIRVRQAIAHAVNREEMVAFVGQDVARASVSVVPQGYLGYSSDVPLYKHDIAKAKALLKEAGYPDGITLKVIITKVASLRVPMEVLQAQMRKAGINLDLEVVEHSAFHKLIRQDSSDLVLYGAARFPVADSYLTQFYLSDSIVGTPTAITNFSHCDVADVEITTARSEADPAKQLALWKIAQQKILKQSCSVPIFEQLIVWARTANLDYGFDMQDSLSNGPIIDERTSLK